MDRKQFVIFIFTSFAILFAGCGTIGSRATTKNPPPFAGIRADLGTLGGLYTNPQHEQRGWAEWLGVTFVAGIVVADIPVSLVFDTYCLPVDVARQRRQSEAAPTGQEASAMPLK